MPNPGLTLLAAAILCAAAVAAAANSRTAWLLIGAALALLLVAWAPALT